MRLFLAATLVGGAYAIEPITISAGTIFTILGVVGSLLSFLIVAIRFLIAWTLLALIVFILAIQIIPIFQRIDLVSLLERVLAEASLCSPTGPEKDDPERRGNAGYRNSPLG